MRLLLALSLMLHGSLDVTPKSTTLLNGATHGRFGYTLPSYLSAIYGVYVGDCRDLMIVTTVGDVYDNYFTVMFYNDGELVHTQTVQFSPWSHIVIYTAFQFDAVLVVNNGNKTMTISWLWAWWQY